ncbi:uncharacterized protein LOC120693394 [Panicum virgatum]|uniref:uncharacterized protein LOC120693394 n=1 Tax=Panicum virgatum TaxID=38727 RepID=UPI0019D69F17|nr:uncharacterized protein LOC120693394 [Panicum virgatum]
MGLAFLEAGPLPNEHKEPMPDPAMRRPPSDSCGQPARKQCQRKAWCGLRPRHRSLDCNTGLSIQNREVLENRSSSPLERYVLKKIHLTRQIQGCLKSGHQRVHINSGGDKGEDGSGVQRREGRGQHHMKWVS